MLKLAVKEETMSITQTFISKIQVKSYGIVVNVDQFSEQPSTTKMWHEN